MNKILALVLLGLVFVVPQVLAKPDLVIQDLRVDVTGGILSAQLTPSYIVKNIGDEAVNTSVTVQLNVDPRPGFYRLNPMPLQIVSSEVLVGSQKALGIGDAYFPSIVKAQKLKINTKDGARYQYAIDANGNVLSEDKPIEEVAMPLMITLNPGESYAPSNDYGSMYKSMGIIATTDNATYKVQITVDPKNEVAENNEDNTVTKYVNVTVADYFTADTINATSYNKDEFNLKEGEYFIPMWKRCANNQMHTVPGMNGEHRICIKDSGVLFITYDFDGQEVHFSAWDKILGWVWVQSKTVEVNGSSVKITVKDPGIKVQDL